MPASLVGLCIFDLLFMGFYRREPFTFSWETGEKARPLIIFYPRHAQEVRD